MSQQNFGALYQGKTNWGTPTGDLSRATFDTSTVTLDELAQVVAALVTDLQTLRALLTVAAPAAPTLLTPDDAEVTTDTTPTFDWTDVADADTYEIEIATDSGFETVVQSDTGLETSTYTATTLSEDTYYWRVRSRNVGGASSWTAGRSLVLAALPVNTVAPAIDNSVPDVGDTLTVTNGTWTGSGISYTYQWKRNGSNIASATNSTYLLVTADRGALITCEVTATNVVGAVGATSGSVRVNMILNPKFAVSGDWTLGVNWAITGGQAVATAAPSGGTGNVSQNPSLQPSTTYNISYTLTVSGGTIRALCGNAQPGASRTTSGSYSETLTRNAGGDSLFYFQVTATFTGTIDNVRVVPN